MAKERSPNYPAVGLAEAIELGRKLWAKEKRTTVALDAAVKAMGYNTLSGPARTRLAALRQYGLLEQDRSGVRVSDLAIKILNHPSGTPDYEASIKEAALRPDLFRDLFQTHAEASDDSLKSHLVVNRRFSDNGARKCIQSFRETISLAKLTETDYPEGAGTLRGESMHEATQTSPLGRPSVRVFSWPLAKDVSAELRLTGEKISATHLERLRQYLALAKDALESDEEE